MVWGGVNHGITFGWTIPLTLVNSLEKEEIYCWLFCWTNIYMWVMTVFTCVCHLLSSNGCQADCWFMCAWVRGTLGDWAFVWSNGTIGHSCILADRCLSDSDGCWCYDSLHLLRLHCVQRYSSEYELWERREAGVCTGRHRKQIMMAALQLSLSAYPRIPCSVHSQL